MIFVDFETIVDIDTECLSMRTFYDHAVDIACLSDVRLPTSGN